MAIRTGIYGGSFNPIHNGHIALARQILESTARSGVSDYSLSGTHHRRVSVGLDEVWFVVSPQNPFKINDTLLDDEQRLRLVKKALGEEPKMRASDVEFHLPKPSYMWNTLNTLSKSYPDREFILLIGGDNWTRFGKWYHAKDILSNYRIIIYPRKDDPIETSSLPPNVQLIDAQLLNISSTEIRNRIKSGEPISHLVPENIVEEVKHLYL